MCGATTGRPAASAGVDVEKETVIRAACVRGGEPVAGAYVRLLDATGEFTAEVVTSAAGQFRFFAGAGSWTLRALAPGATVDRDGRRRTGECGRDRRRARSRLIAHPRQRGGAAAPPPCLRLLCSPVVLVRAVNVSSHAPDPW